MAGQYFFTTPVLQKGKNYRWNVVPVSGEVEGPSSEYRYFSIGNECSEAELGTPVLIAPTDGEVVETLTPLVMYDNLTACIPGYFYIGYAQDPLFTVNAVWDSDHVYTGYGRPLDELENCTTYYWRVAAGENFYTFKLGPYSETWSFFVHLPNTLCMDIIPDPGLIPEKIPSPPPDPGDRIWEVIRDAKCRLGPATAYPETGYLPIGHNAKILGRNEDGTWFLAMDPNGITCWGSIIAFDVPEHSDELEILSYDPLPTATLTDVPPYDCSQHKDQTSCSAQSACVWEQIFGTTNQDVCKNK